MEQNPRACSATTEPETGEPALLLHSEEISVSRRLVAGATVQIGTITREHDQLIDETLTHERVEIERVTIGRSVDSVPPIREEGDTTIIPVVEEVVVVERRLILKEEIRIRRVRVTERHRESVTLRSQDAVITRTEAAPSTVQDDRRPLGSDPTQPAQEQQR